MSLKTTTSSARVSSHYWPTTTFRSCAAGTGAEALQLLKRLPFDCCVVDLRLPDMTGFELLETMQGDRSLRDLPIVVFTGKELTAEEEARLKVVAKSIVLKDVQSPERLFDETALFLHRVVAELPQTKRDMIERLHGSNEVLRHRRVLVVDDDIRNIFALTTVLENHEMEVVLLTPGTVAYCLGRAADRVSLRLRLVGLEQPVGVSRPGTAGTECSLHHRLSSGRSRSSLSRRRRLCGHRARSARRRSCATPRSLPAGAQVRLGVERARVVRVGPIGKRTRMRNHVFAPFCVRGSSNSSSPRSSSTLPRASRSG